MRIYRIQCKTCENGPYKCRCNGRSENADDLLGSFVRYFDWPDGWKFGLDYEDPKELEGIAYYATTYVPVVDPIENWSLLEIEAACIVWMDQVLFDWREAVVVRDLWETVIWKGHSRKVDLGS